MSVSIPAVGGNVIEHGVLIDLTLNGTTYYISNCYKSITHNGNTYIALAGFLQGLGTVGQAMGQTQTITPLGGVTTTIAPDQAAYAGAGAGLSQVGSTLSQYYLNMLQQISPAIEVSAGRHVTVIFTQGVELKLPINEERLLDNQELPLNEVN